MMTLTPCEAELLEFVAAHVKAHGVSPSYDEIGVALGLKSNSSVSRHVDALIFKGRLRRLDRCARGLELVETEDHHGPDCDCDGCANARYQHQVELIQAIANEPPQTIRRTIATNFRTLFASERQELLGIPRQAASRKRAAIPSGGAG